MKTIILVLGVAVIGLAMFAMATPKQQYKAFDRAVKIQKARISADSIEHVEFMKRFK